MVIGFAASPGQPALDGEPGGNSPYAAALLKHFAAGGYSFADLMTMVGEEVYLKTRAKQLPWVNSSLRRVLNFGKPAEATSGDEAEIRQGRRALLLSIAGAPDTTRKYVETVAATEGVPLDALYGMLKVLGIEHSADPGQLEAQLKSGAERLKTLLATQTGAAKSDVELARLADLADRAQAEGAIEVALKFRERASARADELDATVDENEANLKQDRLQIGATYADHARTAEINFDFAVSAEMWRKAIDQVETWDETLTAGYRNNLGVALMEAGSLETGTDSLVASVEALEASLKVFDRDSDPVQWARTKSNLGNVLQALGDRERDPQRYVEAAEAHSAALEELTRDRVPLDWATAENNLGNALARIGENQEGTENLEAAVEAFRAALEVRTREAVPLDWAATEDNLGGALSSLAGRTRDPELFEQGIAAFRASLEVQGDHNLSWALTQRNLGLALKTLGKMTGDLDRIREGADAYRASLTVFTKERAPQDYAQTSAILGFALMEIAKAEPTREVLEEARDAFAAAREVFGPLSADDDAYFAGRIDEIDGMLG
jgi:tetratricopeptide (TPR) repeat protein